MSKETKDGLRFIAFCLSLIFIGFCIGKFAYDKSFRGSLYLCENCKEAYYEEYEK